MSDNRTGNTLIRAGAPDGWVVADKSGGAGPIRNDIALVTPSGHGAIVLTVLSARNLQNYSDREKECHTTTAPPPQA